MRLLLYQLHLLGNVILLQSRRLELLKRTAFMTREQANPLRRITCCKFDLWECKFHLRALLYLPQSPWHILIARKNGQSKEEYIREEEGSNKRPRIYPQNCTQFQRKPKCHSLSSAKAKRKESSFYKQIFLHLSIESCQ